MSEEQRPIPRRYEDRLVNRLLQIGIGVAIPLIVNLVMIAYTYGGLNNQVHNLQGDIKELKDANKELARQVNNFETVQAAKGSVIVLPQSDYLQPQPPISHNGKKDK